MTTKKIAKPAADEAAPKVARVSKSDPPAPRKAASQARGSAAARDAAVRASAKQESTHDEIAKRAYAIFEQRGAEAGDYIQDWLQA